MIKAILLGIIEGLTEFLPVSSTGHLILFNDLLSFDNSGFGNIFSVVIQMGAILSVVVYFFKDLLPKDLSQQSRSDFWGLWTKVVVGIIPAALIGIPLEDVIDRYLFNPVTVAIALIIGAVWILFIDKGEKNLSAVDSIKKLSYKQALGIGCFQVLALIPGMSRSAMTIIGGLILGCNRKLAAEFSFFMAIPVLGGAGLIKLIKYGINFTSEQWLLLIVGTVVSFVVAYLVIAAFMRFIKQNTFRPFAYYRIVLGIVVLISVFYF